MMNIRGLVLENPEGTIPAPLQTIRFTANTQSGAEVETDMPENEH
jgi:hypothetical protein